VIEQEDDGVVRFAARGAGAGGGLAVLELRSGDRPFARSSASELGSVEKPCVEDL